jgi:hypothetical protein
MSISSKSNTTLRLCILVMYLSITSVSFGQSGHPKIEGVKFSKKEISLMKRLDQIQTGAGLARSMLKAAPFVQILSATSPDDIVVNIGFNDWEYIYGALQGLGKIQACKTSEAITFWRDVDGNDFSSSKTRTFFEEVQRRADRGCT